MNEYFLHFAWKNLLFDQAELTSCCGSKLKVLFPGDYNRNSGPDFLNARVEIDGTCWAGSIEIHYRSAMWFEHGHHRDHAYNNVILHVVMINDRQALTASGASPETLEMNISRSILERYRKYMEEYSLVACSSDLHLLDPFFIRHRLHSLAIGRLERKSKVSAGVLSATGNDWEETIYRIIAGHLGMKVNQAPFMQLATRTPVKILRKHADKPLQVEALLFGQAGFLGEGRCFEDADDEYFNLLLREYRVLKSKYRLKPMNEWEWRFHRMRPANFPTIRLSQLGNLIVKTPNIFSAVKSAPDISALCSIIEAESAIYWHNHYNFGRRREGVPACTGRALVNTIIINSVIPLLFLYGKSRSSNNYCDKAVDFLDELPPEDNRVVREWKGAGFEPVSAFETQALLELSNYCKNKECLNCHIGTKLISLGRDPSDQGPLRLGEPDLN